MRLTGVLGLLATVSAFFVGLVLLLDQENIARIYHGIWLMPFSFLISATILRALPRARAAFPITYYVLSVLFFVRLVLNPLFIYLAGVNYTGVIYVSIQAIDVRNAIYLISYESIMVAIAFSLFAAMVGNWSVFAIDHMGAVNRISGSRIVYGVFAGIGLCVLIAWGLPQGVVNFLFVREGTVEKDLDVMTLLLRQIMVISAWLSFIFVAAWCAREYTRRNRFLPFLVALLAGGGVLLLIIGDRRSFQIFTGAAVIYVLFTCFPDRKRSILATVIVFVAVSFATMTFYRLFARYGLEYSSSFQSSFFTADILATAFQAYVGGPLQVAIANKSLDVLDVGASNVLFDFVRSFFLVNFLVRGEGMVLSEIYNNYIYEGSQLTGLMIFAASYGHATVGALFAPIFSIINLILSMSTEFVLRRARGLEVKFLFSYMLMRVVTYMFVSTPMVLSVYTLQLLTFGLLIYVAYIVKEIDKPFVQNHGRIGQIRANR